MKIENWKCKNCRLWYGKKNIKILNLLDSYETPSLIMGAPLFKGEGKTIYGISHIDIWCLPCLKKQIELDKIAYDYNKVKELNNDNK